MTGYQGIGLSGTDITGAYKSPLSEVSPQVEKWPLDSGWVNVSYSEDQTSLRYSEHTSQTRGFGGLSLGFVTAIGTGGGSDGSVSRVTQVQKFSYKYSLKRITIRRPWFDPEVFFEPSSWTWKKIANTSNYPLVAVRADETGKPVPSPVKVYENSDVDCPLVPTEFDEASFD